MRLRPSTSCIWPLLLLQPSAIIYLVYLAAAVAIIYLVYLAAAVWAAAAARALLLELNVDS